MIEITCSEDCEPPPWHISLHKIATNILSAMMLIHVEISILLCGICTIQRLNATYRNIETPTDILVFPQYEQGYDYKPKPIGYTHLGDIAIALPIARQHANEHRHSEIEEVTQLTVHGMLHLVGFNHTHSGNLQHDCMILTQQHIYRLL